MEQVQNQWIVEEEEEDLQVATALEGRETLQHRKDRIIVNGVIPPSSSSSSATSSDHSSGVSSAASVEEEPRIQKEEEPHILQEGEEEPAIQKEEEVEGIGNVVENGNDLNDDYAPIGLGLVAEFVGDATNGEAMNTATNVVASQNENSVYLDKQEGNEVNGLKEVQNGDSTKSVLPKNHGEGEFDIQVKKSDVQISLSNEVNYQCVKTVDDKIAFSSELSPLQNSSEVQATTVENFGEETSAKPGPNLTKEIDQQLKEFDVEAVLAKQETHDLFCPNCKSCITKRVILKKRKRSISNSNTIVKQNKLDTELVNSFAHEANEDGHATATSADKPDAKLAISSAHEANQVGHATAISNVGSLEPPTDNYEPERESELFRCLSCFSFFIPIRNGFKLFPNFGGAREPETLQNPLIVSASNLENPSNVAASNANWFISLFAKKEKRASEQGDVSVENSRTGTAEQHHSSSIAPNMLTSPVNGNPEGQLADTAISKNLKPTPDIKPGHGGVNSLIPSTVKAVTIEPGIENGIKSNMSSMSCSDDVVSKSESVLLATVVTTEIHFNAGKPATDANLKCDEGSLTLDKSQKDVDQTPEIAQNIHSSVMYEAQPPAQSFGNGVVANDIASDKQEAFKSSTPQTSDSVPVQGAIVTERQTQIYIGEEPRAETDEPQGWEILKSIVYGGLIESITSLGIVSSAAGSGAAPLSIIAMGFANLIGGLFIIFNNLIELKNNHTGGDTQQMNTQQDRYQELLGRRSNFLLHAVIAVLSFLIFGSVPMAIYGLLIRKDYYPEVKLAVVAAASVVCIILLAIGKVYTTRPPKTYIKTVLQYLAVAVAASGVSYIVGELVNRLLEKFSGSDSGFVLTMPSSDTTSVKPAWTSY